MKRTVAIALLLLAACGEEAPPQTTTTTALPASPAKANAPEAAGAVSTAPAKDVAAADKALAARVKLALERAAKLTAAGIDVTSAGGVVSLWGTVAGDAERRHAAETARAVDGVKSVENRLAIVQGS
jgi:osmotically-inducible protein OsmY